MIYKVQYSSLTARYGPRYIEANSEAEAKRRFAGSAFSPSEFGLISAKRVSVDEVVRDVEDED